MIVCDRNGIVYDMWFHPASYHEVKFVRIRQVVKAVNSQIKVFNGASKWRNITTLFAYLQGYAVGYSFFRKSQIWG